MKTIKYGLTKTAPVFVSFLFIGIAFGAMMSGAGYSPLWTLAMSAIIYAGSMQIAMVPLLLAGASPLAMAAMTLAVNGRHLFYGLGLIEKFARYPLWQRIYMAFSLTDETFSILCSATYPDDVREAPADLCIAVCNHLYWVFGSMVGALLASGLPIDLTGIDFAATAFFTVVCVGQLKGAKNKNASYLGFLLAPAFLALLGDSFLLPTLAVGTLLLLGCKKIFAQEGAQHE